MWMRPLGGGSKRTHKGAGISSHPGSPTVLSKSDPGLTCQIWRTKINTQVNKFTWILKTGKHLGPLDHDPS